MISLPLLKFSWATDAATEQKFSWKHTTQDLTFVVDSFQPGVHQPTTAAPTVVKVTQGTKVLETLQLEGIIQDAQNMAADARRYSIELRHEQLPISALRRCPLLAIRYRLPDGKIRRLQVKFTTDEDFHLVQGFLERLGCPISDVPSGSGRPASSTSTIAAGPSCPPASLSALSNRSEIERPTYPAQPRPVTSTTERQVEHSHDSYRPSTAHGPVAMQQSHVSQEESQAVYRFGRENLTDTQRYGEPYAVQGHLQRSYTLPSQQITESHQTFRPSSAALDSSQRSFPTTSIPGLYPPSVSRRSALSRIDETESTEHMLPPRSVFSVPPIDRAPSTSVGPLSPPRDKIFDRNAAHDTSQTLSQRPSTAPVTQLDDPLIDLIPPRRELPFRRTSGAQRSSDGGSSSRPSSAAALPPLPTPNFVGDAAAPPKRNPSASRIAKPQPKPPVIVDDSARDTSATLRASSPLPTSSNKQARPTSRHDPPDPPQTAGSKRPLSALASSESNAHPYRSAASHLPPTPSSLRPSTVPSSPPRTLPSSDYATAPSSMSAAPTPNPATVPPARDCVDRVAALIAAADPAGEQENLEAYAAMPATERMAVLDDWVAELIGDEGFLALCQDVDGCWRRIGVEG